MSRTFIAGFAAAVLVGLASALVMAPVEAGAQVPTNGLTLWLDAGSLSNLSDGASVGAWSNQSTLVVADSLTASGAARPTFKTSVVYGHPVVRFDGANNFLASGATLGNYIAAGSFTYFVVFNAAAVHSDGVDAANDAVMADAGDYMGLFLKGTNTSSALSLVYTPPMQSISTAIGTGTWELVASRLESGGALHPQVPGGRHEPRQRQHSRQRP